MIRRAEPRHALCLLPPGVSSWPQRAGRLRPSASRRELERGGAVEQRVILEKGIVGHLPLECIVEARQKVQEPAHLQRLPVLHVGHTKQRAADGREERRRFRSTPWWIDSFGHSWRLPRRTPRLRRLRLFQHEPVRRHRRVVAGGESPVGPPVSGRARLELRRHDASHRTDRSREGLYSG